MGSAKYNICYKYYACIFFFSSLFLRLMIKILESLERMASATVSLAVVQICEFLHLHVTSDVTHSMLWHVSLYPLHYASCMPVTCEMTS